MKTQRTSFPGSFGNSHSVHWSGLVKKKKSENFPKTDAFSGSTHLRSARKDRLKENRRRGSVSDSSFTHSELFSSGRCRLGCISNTAWNATPVNLQEIKVSRLWSGGKFQYLHCSEIMATGGFKPSGGTDFLEEWKAKREKMLRAKMNQMNNANVPSSSAGSGNQAAGGALVASEVNNNATPDRGLTVPTNCTSSLARPPSSSSLSLRRNEEDVEQFRPVADLGGKKTVETRNPAEHESGSECVERDASPASGKGKDKNKSSGPSARKGKIEKRKLREKRRSTGVVSLPSVESPEEYDEDEAELKKKEHSITQQNTLQNESVIIDPSAAYLVQDTTRTAASRYKSAANATEEDSTAPCGRYNRTERTGFARYRDSNSAGSAAQTGALEKKTEELERELAKERQETLRLTKMLQDKDEIIGKLKDEIELLNRDLDDIEDENEQLKQENKTLLKVVGQLTR